MQRYIVTGGNRGLGFAIADHLADTADAEVILAVRDAESGRDAARRIGSNVTWMELDLASADSVERFAEACPQPIAGLVNNAGVQFADRTHRTEDGLEQTFAVNHLHALKLSMMLEHKMPGGRLMFIGSGTHNPEHPTASRFGFRGERYRSIAECADGLDESVSMDQLGKDRYATTKFLNLVTTVELARRHDPEDLLVLCLDPGLMPGTDLVRTAPALLRFGWHYVLPIAARLLPDSSTPDRSGAAAAWLMTTDRGDVQHGGIYSYDRRLSQRVIPRVFDEEIGREVVDDSIAMLESQD